MSSVPRSLLVMVTSCQLASGILPNLAISLECVTQRSLGMAELVDLSRSFDAHTESLAGARETAVAGVTAGLIELGQERAQWAWHAL